MKLFIRLLSVVGAVAVLLVLVLAGLVLFAPGVHTSSIEMVLNVMTGRGSKRPADELLGRLHAADGYSVSVFARDLPHPRMLAKDGAGRLIVSNPRTGEVLVLEDSDGDGAADLRSALLTGLRRPHGLALQGGYLYVAESHQLGRLSYRESDGSGGDYEVIADGFTDEGNHWSKSLAVDDEGGLFVAMGSTCNVCIEEDQRRATIMRFDADGSNGRIYASGLRNSVGLAFAPWDGSLYATDNGRDLLGDDYPPCELNRIEDGGFYGWPYLNGDNEPDPDFGDQAGELAAGAIPPVFEFRAHNAPLGIHFLEGNERLALVALHGSWNRSVPDGYRVLRLTWDEGERIVAEDFLWGFEEAGDIVGRPVDIVGDGAGGVFISDDYARVIYRVSPDSKFASASRSAEQKGDRPESLDPELAEAGAILYRSMPCSSCHDEEAATPVSLADLGSRYSRESLADYFLTPTPPMPRYELTDLQRQQLAHYLLARDAAID